jgi:hypothetical protein
MNQRRGASRKRARGRLLSPLAAMTVAMTMATIGAIWAGSCVPTANRPVSADLVVAPVDCKAAEVGLEFGPFTVADFEETVSRTVTVDGGTQTDTFVGAQYLYSYFDGTSNIGNPGYQPRAELGNRCGDPNNHVFHMTGGPFLGWGGGMGIAMEHFAQDQGLCPSGDITNPNRPSYCAPASAANGNYVAYAAMNLSEWDGVAVWARRGPTSQPLLRVLVGTKDTDDDIAYLMYDPSTPKKPLYCQRVRECGCLVNDLTPEPACTQYDTLPSDSVLPASMFIPGFYCGRPGATAASLSTGNNYCNTSACDAVYPAYPNNGSDAQFLHKPCTPFTYRSGTQTSLCYDPATETPAQSDQQCGDHFTFPLTLTTEWKLYLIPFKTMYQQGFGKKAETFDLTSLSAVRLTWDAGPIDYYVDDLRFYRTARK